MSEWDDLLGQEFELDGQRCRVAIHPITGQPVVFRITETKLRRGELDGLIASGAISREDIGTAETVGASPLPESRQETEDQIMFCTSVLLVVPGDDTVIRSAYQKRLTALRRQLVTLS